MRLIPGETFQVGPYRIWLMAIGNDKVQIQAVYQPSPIQQRRTRTVIPTEKYIELKQLALSWRSKSLQERQEVLLKHGLDPELEEESPTA